MLSLPLCGFTPTTRFLYCRDLAFFLSDIYSGDRALIWVVSARRRSCLPFLRDSFLFRHMFGKSLQGGNSNVFTIKACKNRVIFPVANLRLYVKLADLCVYPTAR
jgi:hypothetical protein